MNVATSASLITALAGVLPDSGLLTEDADLARYSRDWSGDLAHDPHGLAPAPVEVALSVDADRYAGLWLRTMTQGTL